MKTVDLGGDRLGSGNKQKIALRGYERSTHDLSKTWRSTMAPGTLVPFYSIVALPGDTHDIELSVNARTLPTLGPLFGSFKVQLDVFQIPIRLYNGKLHMNLLNIGRDMSKIYLPQIEIESTYDPALPINENVQINPSCILNYLGIKGLGSRAVAGETLRQFNAVPYLAMFDIFKQYYSNKQEERGFIIHNDYSAAEDWLVLQAQVLQNGVQNLQGSGSTINGTNPFVLQITLAKRGGSPDWNQAEILIQNVARPFKEVFPGEGTTVDDGANAVTYQWSNADFAGNSGAVNWKFLETNIPNTLDPRQAPPKLVEFPLENIDQMRKNILADVNSTTPFVINKNSLSPYGLPLFHDDELTEFSYESTQEGLLVKTYQSDLFNNWLDTEWIDGPNGVNAISAVSTAGDSFTIDALNLAQKVYLMFNRIAVSGGTYDDWLDVTYDHERAKSVENPIYEGSLIKELAFEEVVSNSAAESQGEEQPLGELAGRGTLTDKHKGGKMVIKVSEPSYIMGIASITPRIDYSQGNRWDVNLKNMNDLHKPQLDGIGFQELITEQMHWADSTCDELGEVVYRSAGKQPAWINYMTDINETFGNFAIENDSMWMTLNRRYEYENGTIKDLTTYIDPVKFNQIFAQTEITSQNFWVQIGIENKARRKMSAKVIPNL